MNLQARSTRKGDGHEHDNRSSGQSHGYHSQACGFRIGGFRVRVRFGFRVSESGFGASSLPDTLHPDPSIEASWTRALGIFFFGFSCCKHLRITVRNNATDCSVQPFKDPD